MPTVSIIIPTYNRLESLNKVLGCLTSQTFSINDFEVLVVSDGSTDGTIEYLRNLNSSLQLKIIEQENQGVAAARNAGIREAQADLILFLDDDVVPSPQLISEHLQSHAALGSNYVVIGSMLAPFDFRLSPWVQWEQDKLAQQYQAMVSGKWNPTARQFYTGNTSLARRILIESGGFDPHFRRAEDVELAYRLVERGVKFYFNPEAIGYHYAQRAFRSWLQTPYAYGRNDVIFAQQKGQSWLLPTVFEEFYTRHSLIRALVGITLDRRYVREVLYGALSALVRGAGTSPVRPLTIHACSALFNLRYYQGISDELGGRYQFLQGLEAARLHLKAI